MLLQFYSPKRGQYFFSVLFFSCLLFLSTAVRSQDVFISEVQFFTGDSGAGEFVELAAPAGTELDGWQLLLYEGTNGTVYDSHTFTSSDVVSIDTNVSYNPDSFGTIAHNFGIDGIQDAVGGVALISPTGEVKRFISWFGVFTASSGGAAEIIADNTGIDLTDITGSTGIEIVCVTTNNNCEKYLDLLSDAVFVPSDGTIGQLPDLLVLCPPLTDVTAPYSYDWTVDQFMGVNLRREDPIEYLNAVGFVREYHDWAIDEGDFYNSNPGGSPLYPDNVYKWNPPVQNQTSTRFDQFYDEMAVRLNHSNESEEIIPICANLKSALPYLSGGNVFGAYSEFFPMEIENLTGRDMPAGGFETPGQTNTLNVDIDFDQVNADAVLPESYLWFSDWANQFTKKYGSNPNDCGIKFHPEESPETGTNRVGYVEIWNEQDKNFLGADGSDWRKLSQFPAEAYAALGSAAYDGHVNTIIAEKPDSTDPDFYPVGVKNADPNMKYVFGGLTEFDDFSIGYVDDVKAWCEANRTGAERVFPYQVINFHHYSDSNWLGNNQAGVPGLTAVSPEEDVWEGVSFKEQLENVYDHFKGPDSEYEDVELWMSEFGYDTNEISGLRVPIITDNGIISDQQEVQGQWLVRSYLEIVSAGWDRAMQFCIRDEISDYDGTAVFRSSGLVRDRVSNHTPKKSYFYVATMKDVLANTRFDADLTDYTATDIVRLYRFKDIDTDEFTYAIWSPTSENKTVTNFTFTVPASEGATQIELIPGDVNGRRTALVPVGGALPDQDEILSVAEVTERPLFVKLGESTTDIIPPCFAVTNNLQATGISCDAVNLTWNPVSGVEHYEIYYLELPDSQENGQPTELDLSDLNVILYSNDLPGDISELMIAGLSLPLDEYHFFIVPVYEGGITGETCIVSARTSDCNNNNLIPDEIEVAISEAEAEIRSLFNYSYASPCLNLSGFDFSTEGWVNFYAGGVVLEEATLIFNEAKLFEAVEILDGTASGNLIIEYKNADGEFTEAVNYFAERFAEWVSFPLNFTTTEIRLRRLPNGSQFPGINRIIFKGRPDADTAFSTACCGENEASFTSVGSAGTTTLLSDVLDNLEEGEELNKVLQINGTLEIDTDYNFSGSSHLYMNSGAEILVGKNIDLFITENTVLEGCAEMWQGITVDGGGKIVTDQVFIRDAASAVRFLRREDMLDDISGPEPQTRFTINETVFSKNGIGIEIPFIDDPLNKEFAMTNSVHNSVFDGTVQDYKPCPSGLDCGGGNRTGIVLENVSLHNFGSLTDFNDLQNLNYGIRLNEANIIVTARLRDIQPYVIEGIIKPQGGFGIIGNDCAVYFNGEGKDVGNTGFVNVQKPVNLKSALYSLQDTRFEFGDYGIRVKESLPFFNVVADNYFNVNGSAITLLNAEGGNTEVSGNEIFGNKLSTADAVFCSSFSPAEGSSVFNIHDNATIKVNNGIGGAVANAAGIRLQGTEGARVVDNTIEFTTFSPGISTYGIFLSDSRSSVVAGNVLTGINRFNFFNSPSNPSSFGYFAASSEGTIVQNNDFDFVRFPMTIEGDNTAADGIRFNSMERFDTGLRVKSNANIGVQFHQCNKWIFDYENCCNTPTTEEIYDDWFNFSALLEGDEDGEYDETYLEINRFFVKIGEEGIDPETSNSESVFPAATPELGDAVWFVRQTEEEGEFPDCDIEPELLDLPDEEDLIQVLEDNFGENNVYRRVIKGLLTEEDLPPATIWVLRRHVYQTIYDLYGDFPTDSDMQAFLSEYTDSTVGLFELLDRNTKAIYQMEEEAEEQLNNLNESIKNQTNDLLTFLEQISLISIEEQQTLKEDRIAAGTDNSLAEDIAEYNEILQENALFRKNAAAALLIFNNSIPTTQVYEVLEQEVNALYYGLLSESIEQIDTEQAERMLEIGLMCPQEAGQSVFKARKIYALYDPNPLPMWECPEQEAAERSAKEEIVNNEYLTLQPNPTNDWLEISLNNSDDSVKSWQIFDLTGRLVQQGEFLGTSQKVQLNSVQAGLYHVLVDKRNGEQFSQKLVIIK